MKRAVLALTLFAGAVRAADAPTPPEAVERRLREAREEVRSIGREMEGVLAGLERGDRDIENHRAEVDRLATQIAEARARQVEADRRVAVLSRELERLRQALVARLGALHWLGRRGLGPILLRAPGERTAANRQRRTLQAVLDHDRALLAELRDTRDAAIAARAEAVEAARTLARRGADHEREAERLAAARADKESLLASLRRDGAERTRLVDELERSARKLEQLLREETSVTESDGSRFVPPLGTIEPGIVVARNGVEVPAPAGAEVRAVAAGRVVFADWFPGYGKMVIVDHGAHLHSIYGYAEEILVTRGQRVGGGDPIARVGRTGLAPTTRLYFEMRLRGAPQPPERYVPALARSS